MLLHLMFNTAFNITAFYITAFHVSAFDVTAFDVTAFDVTNLLTYEAGASVLHILKWLLWVWMTTIGEGK